MEEPVGLSALPPSRPPLTLCTTAWDALRHGRPAAKDVTQRSDNGAERRRGRCPGRAGRSLRSSGSAHLLELGPDLVWRKIEPIFKSMIINANGIYAK